MNKIRHLKDDNGKLYRKFKRYWRLFLIPRDRLDYVKFKIYALFKYEITQGRAIDYMLSQLPEFKSYYDTIQNILAAYDQQDCITLNN